MKHLIEDPRFEKLVQSMADEQGMPVAEVRDEAESYLKELYTEHNPLVDTFAIHGVDLILNRAYDKTIDVKSKEIKALARVMRRHPVAFVMTHKTYIDMLVLGAVLARHGLPLPYTFAGINMSFMGLGEFGRKAGAIFIRRSFKDNVLYKSVLRYFITSLIDEKAHFMWAIEGTRSRTGKLVWPKMGILKYILEGEQQSAQQVKYVPVSVVYDLIPDVQEMTEEGRGKSKQAESLMWFVNYIRQMGDDLGKISLRVGRPLDHTDEMYAALPEEEADSPETGYTLPRFAFELVHRINQITPVTTSSLICISLLSSFAQTKVLIEKDVVELMSLIENHKVDAMVDRGVPVGASVQRGLNLLLQAGLIQKVGEGIRARYAIVTQQYLSAAYYANMAAHHLYHRAFIEMALLHVSDKDAAIREIVFWEEIMRLRDIFKFEFFYSEKSLFSDEIEEDLKFLGSGRSDLLTNSEINLNDLLKTQKLIVAPVVLFTYIEAYRVVARALMRWDPEDDLNRESLLKACLFHGEEMHWQGQVHRVESVSKPFLLNGIRLIKNRKLVPDKSDNKRKGLQAFLEILDNISDRIYRLQQMVLNRPVETMAVIPLDRNVVPGSKTEGLVAEVLDAPSGPHIGAFFDLDRTLIRGFSAKEFFQTRLMSGKMSAKEIVAQFAGVLVYAMGNRNFGGLASIGARGVRGLDEKLFIEVGEEAYLKHLADEIYPESRALVAAHIAKGHTVAIISAATPYQVDPIARDLEIHHVLCTRMKVSKGKFTGDIIEPPCWGSGKATAAHTFAEEHELDLTSSYFYTDSISDLPLLEIVGNPKPLNPDRELSAVAFKNDWPVHRFSDENRSAVSNIFRTALAFGSIVPIAAAGALTGSLTMSRKDGINNMISLIGEIGTTLAGIKLAVKGEENMWKIRPAVFIFNHQSNADFFIAAKLLQKDVIAIAKKELASYPVIGQIFKSAGVVFIDRKNKDQAIEAMKPAVDKLKDGTSVAIAPEGTRSHDYTLGQFKKGAFHLAMEAGVPIVPMIIKNAHDVLPRGQAILKPTVVEVVIKAPVPTKGWKKENLDERIKEVRDIYLKELGQLEIA